MVDATVSMVLKKLAPMIEARVEEEVCMLINSTDEAKKLASKLKKIQEVLMDAERKGVTDPKVKSWLDKLREISYDIDDVLDEWDWENIRLQMEKSDDDASQPSDPWHNVSSFLESVCLCFRKVVERRNINSNIKKLNERLDTIGKENEDEFKFIPNLSRDAFPAVSKRGDSVSFVDVSEIHGREHEKENLVTQLLSEGSSRQRKNAVPVISIVGPGGMGKTTLAQFVFNDDKVKNHFQVKIWVCVSDPFDEIKIANAILEELNVNTPNRSQFQTLLRDIERAISGKNFLLVLDDVWTEDDTMWKPLRIVLNNGASTSRILVTTRKTIVAKVIGSSETQIQSLTPLEESHCWNVFSKIAFHDRTEWERENLKDTGLEIVKKCKGLPLAAKTIGSLLRFKSSLGEWQKVLRSQLWELEKVEAEIFPVLVLSYNELHPIAKGCFSYCAIFPKDTRMEVETLIRIWCAQGFLSSVGSSDDMEQRGREIFDDLAMRFFFQDFKKEDWENCVVYCKMHDIIHDFAQSLTKNECAIVENVDGGAKLEHGRTARHVNMLVDINPNPMLHERCRSFLTRKYVIPPDLFSHLKKVRMLILTECNLKVIPREIGSCIHLRYLGLSRNSIKELPEAICDLYNLQTLLLDHCKLEIIPREIGSCIHLRYLDLSWNPIEELPETICDLYNLQTLMLVECGDLSGLPQGIHKLKNLRHIENFGTQNLEFPEGIEELTNLWTLSEINVSRRNWKNLGLLRNLNQLRGYLTINIWSSDDDATDELVEAVEKANLKDKNLIQELQLCYEGKVPIQVMEALQPPSNLQRLDFKGPYLPKWVTTLTRLRHLTIDGSSSSLPALGKLPFLESLFLEGLEGMERVSREILGIDDASQPTAIVAFPRLKTLQFWGCSEWKEWEDISEEEENNINISLFPSLEKLEINSCPQLEALPHRLLRKASSLRHLLMINCGYLKERYKDWERVSEIHKLTHIPTTGVIIC